uniref:MYND-type domain-containing protein n=1 Tax=Globisporangium ultimum (strain ATCC 200006 / CBS 805.95 / DAOM BR144) TaxID=431595 RepID=K3WL03_GLOUD
MVGEQERARKAFYVVYVPADAEKELEEWQVALPEDKEAQLGCLTDRLRAHFKQNGSGNSEAKQQEIFKQQLLSQLPKGTQMTDEMLQMMLQMDSLVDSFPLMTNTRAVSHIGVNMYVDDKGTAKGLPTNMRASAIAQACGKMIEVRGDAFIARVFDNDDDFERMDFRLSEVTMDADWIKIGKEQSVASADTSASSISSIRTPQKAIAPLAAHVCGAAMCSANASLRCSRCKNQHYCSAKCQKADWKTHKLSCTKA